MPNMRQAESKSVLACSSRQGRRISLFTSSDMYRRYQTLPAHVLKQQDVGTWEEIILFYLPAPPPPPPSPSVRSQKTKVQSTRNYRLSMPVNIARGTDQRTRSVVAY